MRPIRRAFLASVAALAQRPRIARRLVPLAEFVILKARGFSYDPLRNGEYELICRTTDSFDATRSVVFFDVGANVGDWTKLVLTAVKGEAEGHLFEPTRSTFETLTHRYADESRLRCNELALSSTPGLANLLELGPGHGQNSLLVEAMTREAGAGTFRSVRTETGDHYCKECGIERISLLKIDAEGWDHHVLLGFQAMLKSRAIDVVQFEYGYANGETGYLMSDSYRLLEDCGYSVGPIRRTGVEFRSFRRTDNDFMSGPNYCAALPQWVPVLQAKSLE